MLTLITVDNRYINVNQIMHVLVDNADDDEGLDDLQATIYFSDGSFITLMQMDAVTFLHWWDSIACDVYSYFEESA